jgi:hypothetical protein
LTEHRAILLLKAIVRATTVRVQRVPAGAFVRVKAIILQIGNGKPTGQHENAGIVPRFDLILAQGDEAMRR